MKLIEGIYYYYFFLFGVWVHVDQLLSLCWGQAHSLFG